MTVLHSAQSPEGGALFGGEELRLDPPAKLIDLLLGHVDPEGADGVVASDGQPGTRAQPRLLRR